VRRCAEKFGVLVRSHRSVPWGAKQMDHSIKDKSNSTLNDPANRI